MSKKKIDDMYKNINAADLDTEPTYERMDREFKIYVNSLPPELDEVAILQVFNEYGRVTGMFHPTNARWAFITYKSYCEAERAIRELNNKKPLYLEVALAKEKSIIREEEEEEQNSYVPECSVGKQRLIDTVESPVVTHNDIKHQQGVGRGRQAFNTLRNHYISQMTMSDRYAENRLLSLYELEEPTVNPNRLWTRGVITVTEDGRRHVSLGRGYTLYEFPEQNPKVEASILKVFEKRQNGLYEYGEDKFKNGVQKCLVCFNKTTKCCEKCKTYYCSIDCQKKDWPQHRVECQAMPKLVDPVNTVSKNILLPNNKNNQTKIPSASITSKTIGSDEVKLRRPNTPNSMQAENLSSTSANTVICKNNQDITNYSTDGINIQDKHLSIRHDNVAYTKTSDQSASSTMNTKDFSKRNQSYKYTNTKEDTENLRGNDIYPLTTSNFTNQNRSHNHQNGAIKKTSFNKETFDNCHLRGKNYNSDRNQSYQRNELKNDRKSTVYNDKENANRQRSNSSSNSIAMDNDIDFYKNTYLLKAEFTEVEIIVILDNNEYWISKVEDLDAITDLMTKLQKVAAKARNVQPIIGEIYGVLYETVWHRAQVISLNPVKVHYVDYGNDEILAKDTELKELPDMKVPYFARKIRLTPDASKKCENLQCGNKIFVKMLSIDTEKTIIVDVKEQPKNLSHMENASNINNTGEKFVQQENLKASNENITTTVQIPSILDVIADMSIRKEISNLEFKGLIQINESTQENIYSALLVPQFLMNKIEMLFNDEFQLKCAKMQQSVDYKPGVEDLICGEAKDGWCRGYIVPSSTTSDLRIIAIDEGRIVKINKILPCPKEFLNIYAIGVICEVSHPNKLKVEDIYHFTIMNEQSNKQENFKIKLMKDSTFVCEATIKSYKCLIKPSVPAFSELKSGSKICLTSYRNHYHVFARSLDEDSIEYYNNIIQRVAQCARTAPRLSDPPSNMQAVIAPFSDNNSYRALFIKMQNDKAQIVYTDFGNVDNVNIKDLQVLPGSLALQRSCSAKISLKDVSPNASMNTEVDLFLRQLVSDETPLTCVYEGDLLNDGVYLTMSTGESVNDKINQLLVPTWKQDNHKG
ncbi:uncharacterized protein Vret isoform X2 [Anoplolepis gracilipes]|uniref:uncharacterized protein Vret isoform X2 n=1 Tax=Anoplolepis gracilipes TaxID=354296 RepID=UPI003BA2101E